MKRLSSQVKAIADAHINAMMTGKFDDPDVKTKEQVIELGMCASEEQLDIQHVDSSDFEASVINDTDKQF